MSDPATDRDVLIAKINELAVVHGEVTLAPGFEPTTTWTCGGSPWTVRPRRDRSGDARLVADWDFEAVGGLTLGADPVATAMLHAAAAAGERLDAFVVRKAQKAARAAAPDRGRAGGGAPGAGGGGHEHHRWLGA